MTSVQKRTARSMPLRELTASTATPIASVAANLMPLEIVARRRLGWLKRRLGFALVTLVALVALVYALFQQSTASSRDDLAAAREQTSGLLRETGGFSQVVQLQAETAQIRTQLAGVMTGDLPWQALLASLNRVAPAGLVITDVAGELTGTTAASAPQPGAYTAVGEPPVGTLAISGTAKDYSSVAAFVDALARVRGIASVEPGSLGSESRRATFTISASITKAALGGRFTTGAK